MSVFEVPTIQGNQQLSITLAGITYNLLLKWNDSNATYVLDIADASGNPIISGIPLVAGVDLLAQYDYLGFGGQLIAQEDASLLPPEYEALGSTGHLYFVTSP